jgi:hypothetical protein
MQSRIGARSQANSQLLQLLSGTQVTFDPNIYANQAAAWGQVGGMVAGYDWGGGNKDKNDEKTTGAGGF